MNTFSLTMVWFQQIPVLKTDLWKHMSSWFFFFSFFFHPLKSDVQKKIIFQEQDEVYCNNLYLRFLTPEETLLLRCLIYVTDFHPEFFSHEKRKNESLWASINWDKALLVSLGSGVSKDGISKIKWRHRFLRHLS